MKTKTRKNLLKLVGICCVSAVALSLSFATGNITAAAETPDKVTGFYMEDGAAVAKTDDLDAAISWKTTISADYYTYLTGTYAKVEFATLIAPNTTLADLEAGAASNVIDQDWLQNVTAAGTYRVSLVYRPDEENTQLTDEQKNNAYDMALTALSYVDCYDSAEDTEPTRIYADYTDKDTTRSARGVAYQHLLDKSEKLDYIGAAQTNKTVETTQYFDVNYKSTETSLNGYVNTGLTGFTNASDVWADYSIYYGPKKIATPEFTTTSEGELLIAGFDEEVSYTHTYEYVKTYSTSGNTMATKSYKHGNGVKENITLIAKNGNYLEIPLIACSRVFTNENFSKTEWEKWFKPAGGGAVISGYFVLGEDINNATAIQGAEFRVATTAGANQAITNWGNTQSKVYLSHNFKFNGLYHTLKVNLGWGGLFGSLLAAERDVNKACNIFNIVLDVTFDSFTNSGAFVFGNEANVRLENVIIKLGTYTSDLTSSVYAPSLSKMWRYGKLKNVIIEGAKFKSDTSTSWLDYSAGKTGTQGMIAWSTMAINADLYDNVFVVCDSTVNLKNNTATNSSFTRFDDYAVVNAEGESKTGFYSTDGTVASRWEGASWMFAYDATNNTVGFKK